MNRTIILQYTSVLDELSEEDKYATTINKFEFDVRSLLEAGYKSVSLLDAIKQTDILCNNISQKLFSIVFIGGYLDNYTNAFNVIKRYNIKAAIFISTDLVGFDYYPERNNFIPHFGWQEAQKMINTGLVNVYPLWHYFDQNKNFSKEIQNKIKQLEEHLTNNGNIIAVSGCTTEQFNEAKPYGIEILLCNFNMFISNSTITGLYPMISVNHDEEALDVVEQYLDLDVNYSNKKITNINSKSKFSFRDTTIVLPIDTNPIARNYLHIATPFSVIGAMRRDKAERQVANHLIDVIFKPQYDLFDYHCDAYEYWECLDCTTMSKNILDTNNISIDEYIINGLNIGYYCDIWLDVFYIPGKMGYNTEHFSHGLLIYGYNSRQHIFNTVTYDTNGFYRNIDVSIDNFKKAISNEHLCRICLLKLKPGINAKYNKKYIFEKLTNYINSYHYEVETSFNKNTPDQYVQFNACIKFSGYIESKLNLDENIPNTAIYSYTEHKRLMAWRIKYIMQRENLVNQSLIDISTKITINSKLLLSLSLKYNIVKNHKLKTKIVNTINSLNALEKAMLETFLLLQS